MAPATDLSDPSDVALMARAIARAQHSRLLSPPNPWVGAVIAAKDGTSFEGATQRPGMHHAERVALDAAEGRAAGATLYVTLEPCNHSGRTGPCVKAIVEAGISRVVVAIEDPDPRVRGTGIAAMKAAGIEVDVGIGAAEVSEQLRPYLHHRRTKRPFVVLKMAATLDGQTATRDGSSQWITGAEARADVHMLRAQSDAILIGAGTVRSDDPNLTVRGVLASDGEIPREPIRVVLGQAPDGAKIRPCLEMSGELEDVLDHLGSLDVVQLMVEGGARVAGDFHRAGLVDTYVVYLAPALMGGSDGAPLLAGAGAGNIADIFRGQIIDHTMFGRDLRVTLTGRH